MSLEDTQHKKEVFTKGFKNAIPIGLGYFAVSFSLGITAAAAGFRPFEAFLVSFLCNASAGEYAGFALFAAGGGYIEAALVTLIANARYLLMSFAMSLRLKPREKYVHRLCMSFAITDELFALMIASKGYLNPWYMYGAMLAAMPCWAFGTYIGAVAGNILPQRFVSALGVALYGMFLAVIIPPARKNRVIAGLIALCFLASFCVQTFPFLSVLSGGTGTIVLTVLFAAGAALFFPQYSQEEEH